MKNKIIAYFTLSILLLSIYLVSPGNVYATNFSQWCYGTEDIFKIGVNKEKNEVWAISKTGKIAKFDGVKWTEMESGTVSSVTGRGEQDDIRSTAFDFSNGNERLWVTLSWPDGHHHVYCWEKDSGWVYKGVPFSNGTIATSSIVVDNNGNVYVSNHINGYLYKWDGQTGWTLKFKAGDYTAGSDSLYRAHAWYYDGNSNRIYALWSENNVGKWSRISYYDIDSNSGHYYTTHSLLSSTVALTSIGNDIYVLASSYVYYYNGSSWANRALPSSNHKNIITNGLILLIGGGGSYNTIVSGLTSFSNSTWPFSDNIQTIAIGGYAGELYAAGNNGIFAVYMNNQWYTDSNLFTDYIISELKKYTMAAKVAADNAYTAAGYARDRTWYTGTYGGSAENVADLAGYIRNNQLPAIESNINNILSNIGPQIQKVYGRNGATATVNTTFDVVIQTTGATEFRARVENGSWSNWVLVGTHATVTGISGTGARTIQVEARNGAGVTTAGQVTVFKI